MKLERNKHEVSILLFSVSCLQDCCVWAMGLLAVECTALTILRLTSCSQTEDHRKQLQGVKRMVLLLPDDLKVLQLGAHISLNSYIMQVIGEKQRFVKLAI